MEQPVNPQTKRQIQEHRKAGLGWRCDGLGDWTTEAIIDKLRELGVDTSAGRFPDQARTAGRCAALGAGWVQDLKLEGSWTDFAFLAAEELWERFTPDLLCPEIVAARLDEAIQRPPEDVDWNAPDVGKEDIEAAMVLMDYLEDYAPHDREKAFDEVIELSANDFGIWLVGIACESGSDHATQARRIADVMSETEYAAALWTDLAYRLVADGQPEEAEQIAERNLKRWPKDIWVRIKSGDIYADAGDAKTAVGCYVAALKMVSDPMDWEGVAERLGPLLRELGRSEEWDKLSQEHPKPAGRATSPFLSASHESPQASAPIDTSGPIGVVTSGPSPQIVPASVVPLFSKGKVGRNAPCPCGSGKKYKKCCLGRD